MLISDELANQLNCPRRRKYLNFEHQIWLKKFKEEDFTTGDLVISPTESMHYTVIARTAQNEHNKLVVLHGYGGFGGVFYRLVDELSRDFFIVLVDLPDMGFSSRKKEELFKDTESAIAYFVNRIETFIEKIGLLRFSLMGHSIGALLSAHLFARMHGRINMLYLLSPAGFNPVGDPHFAARKTELIKKMNFFQRFLLSSVEKKLYEEKQSPFEMYWVPMRAKKWLIRKYWNNPRFRMNEEESRLFYKIQAYFLSLPQCGERCLGYLLHYGVNSHKPIIDVLQQLKEHREKVRVYFGDNDWMDSEASRKNIESRQLDIPVFFVSNAEHQLIFQNPTEIANNVLEGHSNWLEKRRMEC